MNQNNYLHVHFKNDFVGTLAMTPDHKVAFEYSNEWLKNGFPISPFSLPLTKKVFVPSKTHFNGLFGVFADSLPDAWGNILLNRLLKSHGIAPDHLTPLDRLAIVGSSGMGALTYHPEKTLLSSSENIDLDSIANECQKILSAQPSEKLDELYHLGGTSGGARPKIMTNIAGEDWIIKFPAHVDGKDAGLMEYEYSLCAKKCGITMPETKLFPSRECAGYFGIQRFDRSGETRIHMLTAAALLELDFRIPSLDYHSLIKLTKILTIESKTDIENMFRRMCFNVFAHNRDDHSKNFSFIYDEKKDIWRLSPAYDLTYSTTYYGEHTTTVNQNGKNPSKQDLIQVGTTAGMKKTTCSQIIDEIETLVNDMLSAYLNG